MYDLGVELRQAGGYVDKETQESVNIEDGFRAVSYTHLDVYKRQLFY